jgi:cytochrome c oxidase assembly factor CtaG
LEEPEHAEGGLTATRKVRGSGRLRAWTRRYTRMMLLGAVVDLVLLADPIDPWANANLTVHMFQHIGLFVGSGVFGYGFERYLVTRLNALRARFYAGWKVLTALMKANVKTRGLFLGALVPAFILTFWHWPSNFEFAVSNLSAHIVEHFSFMLAGGLVGMSILAIPSKLRIILLYIAFMQAGMMGSMMLVWPYFYPTYSALQNTEMDSAMMMLGALGIIASSSALLKRMDVI